MPNQKRQSDAVCHSCGSRAIRLFYQIKNVPVHSVLLLPTREIAVNYPKGDIVLGLCTECGLIFNVLFDSGVHEYSSSYEETQGFSAMFTAFHRKLAQRLIDRYDLHGKEVIEIGCGKGEFLSLLCELGDNHGVGFDPAYIDERNASPARNRMRFITEFYSDKYPCNAAFVCCKMTLEHIQDTAAFVETVSRSVGNKPDTVVFFQVPNVTQILRDLAFWDIYYEHCSYFSSGSLARLFRSCGFAVIRVDKEYDDQYLTIEARPANGQPASALPHENDLQDLERDVIVFEHRHLERIQAWKRWLRALSEQKSRAVLWGGGSKAVAFLTTLDVQEEIQYVVDINPYRAETYIAGTGQRIVAPQFLQEYGPDLVIVMNPVYRDEIGQSLNQMRLHSKLVTVDETPKGAASAGQPN